MNCPDCGYKLTLLLTSSVCDRCDGLVGEEVEAMDLELEWKTEEVTQPKDPPKPPPGRWAGHYWPKFGGYP